MSNFNSTRSWKRTLSDLGGFKQSRFSKAVATIGCAAAVVFASLFGFEAKEDGWVMKIFLLSFAVMVACLVALAVRRLSIHRTGHANAHGIAVVFGRVMLYIFLPAAVITFITVTLALSLRQ